MLRGASEYVRRLSSSDRTVDSILLHGSTSCGFKHLETTITSFSTLQRFCTSKKMPQHERVHFIAKIHTYINKKDEQVSQVTYGHITPKHHPAIFHFNLSAIMTHINFLKLLILNLVSYLYHSFRSCQIPQIH